MSVRGVRAQQAPFANYRELVRSYALVASVVYGPPGRLHERRGQHSDEDPETCPPDSRFPTREELRFWAFSDLTIGVTGLLWWSWSRAAMATEGDGWLEETFWPHLAEQRAPRP